MDELYQLCKNPPEPTVWNNFWNKVDVCEWNECWEWRGPVGRKGFGLTGADGKQVGVHTAVCIWLYGPLSRKISAVPVVCGNGMCVNPLHLLSVKGMNMRLATAEVAASEKEFCPFGHALFGSNLLIYELRRGIKSCRACKTRKRFQQKRFPLRKTQ